MGREGEYEGKPEGRERGEEEWERREMDTRFIC